MSAVRSTNYVQTRCTTCKPGPDGSLTGVGWLLAIAGACGVLIGICVLLSGARSNAVQPADWASHSVDALLRRQRKESNTATGRGFAVVGCVVGVLGLIVLGFSNSGVDADKSQLRLAASNLVEGSVEEAVGGMGGDSPRDHTLQAESSADAGVYLPVEYIFSSAFGTNGEVTVHDKQDNRSVCVTVPDSDAAATVNPGPGTPPLVTFASVDPSPYITDGACPDAPVTSSN